MLLLICHTNIQPMWLFTSDGNGWNNSTGYLPSNAKPRHLPALQGPVAHPTHLEGRSPFKHFPPWLLLNHPKVDGGNMCTFRGSPVPLKVESGHGSAAADLGASWGHPIFPKPLFPSSPLSGSFSAHKRLLPHLLASLVDQLSVLICPICWVLDLPQGLCSPCEAGVITGRLPPFRPVVTPALAHAGLPRPVPLPLCIRLLCLCGHALGHLHIPGHLCGWVL